MHVPASACTLNLSMQHSFEDSTDFLHGSSKEQTVQPCVSRPAASSRNFR